MNLRINEWKPFKISDIFYIKYGVNLELNACEETSSSIGINFVSRTEDNNGVSSKILEIQDLQPQPAGLISVAGGGSVLSTFLQPKQFYSGRDLYVLKCKANITNEQKLFLITIIKANKYRFNYGRQANKTLGDLELMLPIKKNPDNSIYYDSNLLFSENGYYPDFELMDAYVRTLNYKKITTKNIYKKEKIDTSEWKCFKIKKLFENKKTKKYSSIPDVEGDIDFISSSSFNNGKSGKVDAEFVKGNCITISTNGKCFDCFYHSSNIAISTDVEVLYAPWLNKYNGLFICTLLKLEQPKWNYGRKPKSGKIFDITLLLPVLKENGLIVLDNQNKYSDEGYIPDFEFMEKYIKSLPYADKI